MEGGEIPELVKHWWGPKGFTSPVSEIDLRVGGSCITCMPSPYGQDYWSTGIYREIVEPERIVCTDSFSDSEGNVIPASNYGMSGEWPLRVELSYATFEEYEGKTMMTLQHVGIPAGENRDLTEAGWNESFSSPSIWRKLKLERIS